MSGWEKLFRWRRTQKEGGDGEVKKDEGKDEQKAKEVKPKVK